MTECHKLSGFKKTQLCTVSQFWKLQVLVGELGKLSVPTEPWWFPNPDLGAAEQGMNEHWQSKIGKAETGKGVMEALK